MCSNESCGLGHMRWGAVLAFLVLSIWALYTLWQQLRSVGFNLHVPPKAVVPHLQAEPVSCWMKLVGHDCSFVQLKRLLRRGLCWFWPATGEQTACNNTAIQYWLPCLIYKNGFGKKELANVEGNNWTSPCVHDVWVQGLRTQTLASHQIVVWVVVEQFHWSNLRSKGK